MSSYDLTEAVRAARPLLVQAFTDANALVESMLTAALPHLEQQIRKQVGNEIEAEYDRRSPIHIDAAFQYNGGVLDGLDIAEQIARTRKDT